MPLGPTDTWAIINALNVAATVYEADSRKAATNGHLRLREQFASQARRARELARLIENVGVEL
ncbi:MAG TPA: hypothetical protein VMT89_07650 [Candidatus Acidoferrales bacterium]|nr:hypothetical protein [Candidatus Acidoferrales bacterium]